MNNLKNMNFFTWFLDMLRQQGLSFVLLGLAVWFMWGELKATQMKSESCYQEIIGVYQHVVHQNTTVMEENCRLLEKILIKLD